MITKLLGFKQLLELWLAFERVYMLFKKLVLSGYVQGISSEELIKKKKEY